MKSIEDLVLNFIKQPFPLWNRELAAALVNKKFNELFRSRNDGSRQYSLSGCLLKDWKYSGLESIFQITCCHKAISLIAPTPHLNYFYDQHGLDPVTIEEFKASNPIDKLERALAMLCIVPDVAQFISHIVKSVQLISAEYAENDVSYSHPDIPFTVFVSICSDNSIISALRVAESILHESMHLLLTLIEGVVPMINSNTKSVYYSPWRDSDRPVRGVLHGLLVFRAISDFYAILSLQITDVAPNAFISKRRSQIYGELTLLKDFSLSPGLTEEGKKLAVKLV